MGTSTQLFSIFVLLLVKGTFCFEQLYFRAPVNDRSSRLEVFCKKGVVRNFAKIHRKTPVPESLF